MRLQFFLRRAVGGFECRRIKGMAAQAGETARAGSGVAVEVIASQRLTDGGEIVAHQGNVCARVQRRLDAFCRIGDAERAGHVEVVADNRAVKATRAQFLDMNGRETGGAVVALREDDMRRHQCFNAAFDLADEGVQVGLALVGTAWILRQDVVRVAGHAAMAGIVFADGDHARRAQAATQRFGKRDHDGGVGMQGTVADDI